MKRLVIPALSLALMAGFPAAANAAGDIQVSQNDRSHNDQPRGGDQQRGGDQGGQQHRGGDQPQGGPPKGQAGGAQQSRGGQQSQTNVQRNSGPSHDDRQQGRSNGQQQTGNRPQGRTNGSPPGRADLQRQSGGQSQSGTNNQRQGHPSANAKNVRNFHRDFSATHHFNAGSYRRPSGYRYQRWTFGQRLPGIYFGRDYWINDYLAYGLDEPPFGYVWVRYGPDALLVDEYTGEIVEVEYGLYY